MYLLDTDSHKLAVAHEQNITGRVEQYAGSIFVSTVTVEEMLVGFMSGINRARSQNNSLSLVQAHQNFAEALEDIRTFPLFVFSGEAEAIYRTFSPATLRIGPQDCRIAAQAIAHNMVVVTRNLRDFEAIGAPCED